MSIEPLTVGFLIDKKNEIPLWECRMLEQLLISEFISEVILIILPTKNEELLQTHESLAFTLFKKFENAWFNKTPDAATISTLGKIENYYGQFRRVEIISEEDVLPTYIDLVYYSYKLKVQAHFNPPRYGSWMLEFGKVRDQTGLPGFWEIMLQDTLMESRLTVTLKDDTSARIAYHSIGLTVPFSVKNNFNSVAFKASQFLPARLRELYLTGPLLFFTKCEKPNFKSTGLDDIKPLKPENVLMCRLFSKNVILYLIDKISKLNKKNLFIILYSRRKLAVNSIDIGKYNVLQPPPRTFWADPFVIKKGADHFIFFEESSYPEWKGQLMVMKIDSAGVCSDRKPILKKPYHLSYPFIFEIEGIHYLIPESSANKTVDLYRCKNFPYEWEFSRTLLQDITLQDATIFYFQNTWWLFATTKSFAGCTSNDQLMIYYCTDIFTGEWHSHAGNPVITDVSNCRPAGKIFMEADKIYRPAQNNASRQYGYSIKINEIEVLTQTVFREKMIREVSPVEFKKYVAVHTINADESMIVIDGILAR
jgi:hypothetical protein